MLRNFCPLRARLVKPSAVLGILLVVSFFLSGCENTSRILNSQTGPARPQINNVSVTSTNLTNGNLGTIQLTVAAHKTILGQVYGSGHIQKADDSSFYSDFKVTSFEVKDLIILKAEITSSLNPDFVGINLELDIQDLGKDHEDQILLKFDTSQKLGQTSPHEFAGPGSVKATP